jgi:hypothetical protein
MQGEKMSDLEIILAAGAGITLIAFTWWYLAQKRGREESVPQPVVVRLGGADVDQLEEVGSESEINDFSLEIQSIEQRIFAPSEMTEIKDSKVVERLDALLVPVVQAAAKALEPSLKDAYRVILPKGADLVKSKEVKGAFRAFFRDGRKIAGNANLQKIDASKAAAITNVAANAMNVASLVVGQYYMAEISSKLDALTDGMNAIADRLDAELKSKVQSELVLVSEISRFRAEILENSDERNRKLISLESHKSLVSQALSQVNILIEQETKNFEAKKGTKGVKSYQAKVHSLQTLAQQQEILVALLKEISNLSFVLGSGEISLEASSAVFKGYLATSTEVRSKLGDWHRRQLAELKIDLGAERAEKNAFEAIPGLLVERWKYLATEAGLNEEIQDQSRLEIESREDVQGVFEKDVEVVMKDGKYYFLHGNDEPNIQK